MQEKNLITLYRQLSPILTLLALPLLLWPSLVLVVALIVQARGAYILKPKHIAILITVQLVWLLTMVAFSSFLILKPLHLKL